MLVDALHHTGCSGCLHTIDLHPRIEALEGKGHPGDEPTAPDRDDDRLHIGQLVEQFEPDGALSGYHILVVKGMDKGVTALIAQPDGLGVGSVVDTGHELHLCSQALRGFHLADGSPLGQTNETLHAHCRGGKSHPLSVVAGRTGYHALLLFGLREL